MTKFPPGAIPVLDHGFIRLVDHMGDDDAIAEAARVSYGRGTKAATNTRGLLRSLMRRGHTSPFEMAEIKLHVKLPIFVARQWIRHRTANVNEASARYSLISEDVYIPRKSECKRQSKTDKQGRAGELVEDTEAFISELGVLCFASRSFYGRHIDSGLSREVARLGQTVNSYTEWYWKIDLHNLLHFLRLRMDSHAQWEIRQYSNAIFAMIEPLFPITMEAFQDYKIGSMTLSWIEIEYIRRLVAGNVLAETMSPTEQRELYAKIKRLGLKR